MACYEKLGQRALEWYVKKCVNSTNKLQRIWKFKAFLIHFINYFQKYIKHSDSQLKNASVLSFSLQRKYFQPNLQGKFPKLGTRFDQKSVALSPFSAIAVFRGSASFCPTSSFLAPSRCGHPSLGPWTTVPAGGGGGTNT